MTKKASEWHANPDNENKLCECKGCTVTRVWRRRLHVHGLSVREMGGAPRKPAPRNHLLVGIAKPSGCHCTDALGGKDIAECRHLLGAPPLFSDSGTRQRPRRVLNSVPKA